MRNKLQLWSIFAAIWMVATSAFGAVKIVQCADENGDHAFYKVCPPGYTLVSEQEVKTARGESSSVMDEPVIVYMVPNCEACEEVLEFLNIYDIPITKKDINQDIAMQEELSSLTGALQVPVAVIGESFISGYNRRKLKDILTSAGYISSENGN